ncbi:hypothetical protein ACQVP2_23225 [Methylobacterium aquaticum]|uniref:hypothetical protein n=1 Tax=Methylobacterium aquaticum TaxID=270351 RepID=UPI003D17F5D4
MNAVSPTRAFAAQARFDTVVAEAFAGARATRHIRDHLIARLHRGAFDGVLLRQAEGFSGIPEAVERRAAINTIDFAFEPLVLASLSVAQAEAYFAGIEPVLRVGEARGLDRPGPLWLDTVHHACVFSVLARMAAFLKARRGIADVVLLHQGLRPEPRLGVAARVLGQVHGVRLHLLPLRGDWFARLARRATPQTAIFSLCDMPPEAFGSVPPRRALGRIALHAGPDLRRGVATVSGSAAFACRLGAAHLVLDYPARDTIRLRPHDGAPALCPVEDWVFWPVLVARGGASASGPAS